MPKKKADGADLSILDVAAPSLDSRLAAAMGISTKLATKFGLGAASVSNPGLQPQNHRRRVTSTGLTSLDKLLKIGGLPRGHVTEFFGPPHGGKSLALYSYISEVQHQCTVCDGRVEYRDKLDKQGNPITAIVDYMVKGEMTKLSVTLRESQCTYCHAMDTGGLAILCDQENSSDPVWLAKQDIELTKLIIMKLPSGEITTEMVRTLLLQIKPEAICIDSIAQLQPKAEQERSDVDDPNLPGLHAKVMAKLCRHLTSIFTMDPLHAPAVVWVNQVRADIAGHGAVKVTGGFAPEHYSSIRLYFLPQQLVNQNKPELGRNGKITVYKGRVAEGLYRKTLEYVLLPTGFDKAKDLFEAASTSGVFNLAKQASGRFYFADDANLENELAYGRDKMLARVQEDKELYRNIAARVLASGDLLAPPEIFVGDEVPGHEVEA